MFDLSSFAQGFGLGLGMFVCPGPKDLVILRQALNRRPPLELLAVGVGSDALLISLGILGVSALLQRVPQVQRLALWIGIGWMLLHAAQTLWRLRHGPPDEGTGPAARSDRAALWVVSFLNPVAWMDTVLVIGTAGAMLSGLAQPSYGLGAVTASAAWFALLTIGAGRASRWLEQAAARRALDLLAALAMAGMAGYVATGIA